MRQHLQMLLQAYNHYDNHIPTCTRYMNEPARNRLNLFNEVTTQVVLTIDKPQNEFEFAQDMARLTDYLNMHYADFIWPCHDVHFHTNINHWLGCPMTCLNEIAEVLTKIISNNFAS